MNAPWRSGSGESVASVLLLPVLAAVLVLAACGGSSTTAATSPSATISPAASAPQSATPLPAPTVAGTIAFMRAVEPGINYDVCT